MFALGKERWTTFICIFCGFSIHSRHTLKGKKRWQSETGKSLHTKPSQLLDSDQGNVSNLKSGFTVIKMSHDFKAAWSGWGMGIIRK